MKRGDATESESARRGVEMPAMSSMVWNTDAEVWTKREVLPARCDAVSG